MEKVYREMKKVGGWNIALGVIMITVGLTVGVLSIIHGGRLLVRKSEVLF